MLAQNNYMLPTEYRHVSTEARTWLEQNFSGEAPPALVENLTYNLLNDFALHDKALPSEKKGIISQLLEIIPDINAMGVDRIGRPRTWVCGAIGRRAEKLNTVKEKADYFIDALHGIKQAHHLDLDSIYDAQKNELGEKHVPASELAEKLYLKGYRLTHNPWYTTHNVVVTGHSSNAKVHELARELRAQLDPVHFSVSGLVTGRRRPEVTIRSNTKEGKEFLRSIAFPPFFARGTPRWKRVKALWERNREK